MTAAEYLERVRTAPDHAAVEAVIREAWADAEAKRLTVAEWNAVWTAGDKRTRSYRYLDNNWTGD